MNTVPFDQLGPGQSGRLAYQVLGQDGPIFNPQNIRYLPPDSPGIPEILANPMAMVESALSAGLAGANLIGSILNLGVSLYIAHRINSLHKKVDHLQEIIDRIEQKIDYIVAKVDRIDTQVAENNLRHALNHVLQSAVSLERVDLRAIADLRGDISKFQESLPSGLVFNFGLQLSSDIRNQLQLTYEFAYGIRKLVAQRYNISVDGNPELIITMNPTEDYFRGLGDDLETLVKITSLKHSVLEVCRENRSYMPFGGEGIKKNLLNFRKSEIASFDEIFTEWGFLDEYLPEELFKDETSEAIEQGLYDLCCVWSHNTDAGLLWRTRIELDGIADGYENTFWPQLKEAEPCGINQIEVACEVPLLENA